MQFSRNYVLLRAVSGHAGGFVRIEQHGGRMHVTLRVTRLPTGLPSLRALLIAGTGSNAAVIDLGAAQQDLHGQLCLRTDAQLAPAALRACHTLVLITEWPDAQLLLYGAMPNHPAMQPHQLTDALRSYMALPPAGVQPPARTARRSLRMLQPLHWPDSIAELKEYFDTLQPIAPFEERGWRYVRVPLQPHDPAPYCAVGVRISGNSITQVAYALPGDEGHPPHGLHGYHWRAGRNDRGYWTLLQHVTP